MKKLTSKLKNSSRNLYTSKNGNHIGKTSMFWQPDSLKINFLRGNVKINKSSNSHKRLKCDLLSLNMNNSYRRLYNFRDLSQYVNKNSVEKENNVQNNSIQKGKLYRCAAPAKLSPEDQRYLIQTLGLNSMIDLRSVHEDKKYPVGTTRKQLENQGGKYFRVEMFGTEQIHSVCDYAPFWVKTIFYFMYSIFGEKFGSQILLQYLNSCGLLRFYTIMLDKAQNEIRDVLRLLADKSNLPLAFFCAAGKDRTGIISALILSLCEIPIRDIATDFHASELHLKPVMDELRLGFKQRGLSNEEFCLAPAQVLHEMILYIEKKYGSVISYLYHIGLEKQEMEAIKRNLLSRRMISANL
eukprot:gb/GECH01013981.1/.p1 GENE.gb/GECH01013981.1/~~gb/GECH01013981.1/.p1  ORF type:complete len:354 (+),score=50.70 gb/GECH01013981.1/:1-1062(+)